MAWLRTAFFINIVTRTGALWFETPWKSEIHQVQAYNFSFIHTHCWKDYSEKKKCSTNFPNSNHENTILATLVHWFAQRTNWEKSFWEHILFLHIYWHIISWSCISISHFGYWPDFSSWSIFAPGDNIR